MSEVAIQRPNREVVDDLIAELYTDVLEEKRKGIEQFRVGIECRRCWFDARDARLKLDLLNLSKLDPASDDSIHLKKQKIDIEREAIAAWRKIDEIRCYADQASELSLDADAKINDSSGVLAELTARAEDLKAKIAPLRARDIRDEIPNWTHLENQFDRLSIVMFNGRWKGSSLDSRPAVLEAELTQVGKDGLYDGEPTKEAVEKRLEELEKQIDAIEERAKDGLDRSECEQLRDLESKLSEVNAAIKEGDQLFEEMAEVWRTNEEKINQVFDIARMKVASLLEIHEINCEMIKLETPV